MANFDRAELTELRSLLSDPDVQRNSGLHLQAVQKVIASMTLGIDVSSLFSDMIKAGGTQNLVQKKLVYLYLGNYAASNSDLALMTVNTLQKDFQDRNPMIRGLALRTLCSLRLSDVVKYVQEPIQKGLKDSNPYVRKTAVLGVLKLFYINPYIVDSMNFVDILYQMLRDRDPQVVSNSIAALSEILASEGGIIINKKIAHYLLNRLHEFSEWGQCQVLDILTHYQPSSEDEVFDILTILDDKLKHPNCGVVLGVMHLFIRLTDDMPQLHEDVYSRIHTPMMTFLCADCDEIIYTFLLHAKLLLAKNPHMWRRDYTSFYCRYTDPVYIKVKKVELLSEICMFESAQYITNELSVYATDVNALVARNAIQAIGRIALRLPARSNICVDKLLSLLILDIDYVISETLVVMTNILRKFDNMLECVLPKIPVSCGVISDPEGKAAFIWILGEYGESLPNTPYILEEVVNGISEESSSDVKLQLLSSVMKMFFKRPPECQEILGRLLNYTINEDNNQDVRDRAMLYYRLLKMNVKTAKQVVCGQPKVVTEDNTAKSSSHLLPEFNTLSVVFDKPSKEFISQRFPYILSDDDSESSGAEAYFEHGLPNGRTVSLSCDDGSEINKKLKRQDSIPLIGLNPKAIISSREFEKNWTELPTSKEIHICLRNFLSPKEFTEILSLHQIMTIASSPLDKPIIRYFFYAQHLSTSHFLFVEVDVSVDNSMLSFILKCENPKQASSFTKHFFQILGLPVQMPSLLEWKTCSDIPTAMMNACGVFYNNQLHIGGGCTGSPKANSIIYAYSPDVDMWKVLPACPLKWFAMAVWKNQLILIGGREGSIKKLVMTNKLAIWEKDKWEFSFPPMKIARVSPTAVAHGNYLAVTGGRRGCLGYRVEILDSTTMQWHYVPSLPINCFPHTTTVCGGCLYLMNQKNGKILYADISTFVAQEEYFNTERKFPEELSDSSEPQSEDSVSSDVCEKEISSIWHPIPKPPAASLRMATIGGYVVAFSHGTSGDGNLIIHAYFPETNSWSEIGKFPGVSSSIACISSPEKQLYIVGGDSINSQYSQKIFKAAMKVCTCKST